MQQNDPIAQLRAYYTLPDAIVILRILQPLLNEDGRASLPFLESELAANPSAARLSISTLGSSRSGRSLASPLFERSSAFSDVSSIASSFIPDNESLSGAPPVPSSSSQRKYRSATGHRVGKQGHKSGVVSATSSPILSPRKPSFECPFCWELKIPTSISRKADLKRHFKQFHQNNAQWICQERGCSMAFDWKSAFEAHLKENHGNTQHASDTNHQVKLCPQTVFACGFSNCRLVFEAASDEDAEKKAQEYFNHVANHFDDNLTHRNWSYSVRIRNLMRQAAVESHWKDRKKLAQDPMWQPHTSSTVKKILETRHFTDIPLLVQWVVNLGSFAYNQPHSPLPKLPADLRLPIRENCSLVLDGHGPLMRRESHRHLALDHAPAPQPQPQAQTQVHQQQQHPHPHQNQPPPQQQQQPPNDLVKMEVVNEPEPEIKTEYPQAQHAELPDHNGLSLPDFDTDPAYMSYHDDNIIHHPHQLNGNSQQDMNGTNDAPPSTATMPSFIDSQPISHWLGMTEPRQNLSLQPHLDSIISYPNAHSHPPPHANGGHQHHMLSTTDFRPVTPAHQLLDPNSYAAASMMSSHGGNTIAPVDLEMNDCTYESEVNCF